MKMLTFTECEKLTAKNGRKNLAGNTVLRRVDAGTFAVRFHDTDIVEVKRNGTYRVRNGGFMTMTTKKRINAYSPAQLYQKNFTWYLQDGTEFKGEASVK